MVVLVLSPLGSDFVSKVMAKEMEMVKVMTTRSKFLLIVLSVWRRSIEGEEDEQSLPSWKGHQILWAVGSWEKESQSEGAFSLD
jgi:hypothetical protein